MFLSELPVVTLFHTPTVRELAGEISATAEIGGPDLIEQMLTELEGLSEAEVQALLGRTGHKNGAD